MIRRGEYTMADLDFAIFYALAIGRPAFNMLMESAGRVAAHKMAIERAFMDELKGEKIDILRTAMQDISKGQYRPVDGRFD